MCSSVGTGSPAKKSTTPMCTGVPREREGCVFRDTHLVVAVSTEVARPDVHGDEFPVPVKVHLLHGREEETSEPRLQTARVLTR